MTDERPITIAARNVGVRYDVRLSRHRTMRRTVASMLARERNGGGEFWAIRDVSFFTRQGDVLGVIGRNGSGKSTLLLTLAGILRPDTGTISTAGDVSALLTLGAGFEPDLTGRENIYLNGAFLGLPRARIESILDEVVEFSGLGEFIDAPLRKYSSGMRARLGFSIAVHIEPDILLLDEVLGVGDASFKQRSREKLEELIARAATIVVVTHNMAFVTEMCTHALWLDVGGVAGFGEPGTMVERYLERSEQQTGPLRAIR